MRKQTQHGKLLMESWIPWETHGVNKQMELIYILLSINFQGRKSNIQSLVVADPNYILITY